MARDDNYCCYACGVSTFLAQNTAICIEDVCFGLNYQLSFNVNVGLSFFLAEFFVKKPFKVSIDDMPFAFFGIAGKNISFKIVKAGFHTIVIILALGARMPSCCICSVLLPH